VFARNLTALVLLTVSTAGVAAQKLDVNLSNDSARFNYVQLVGGSTFGRTEMNAGFLYNEDKNSLFDIGLHVIDMAGSKTPGLEVGVGPKFYYGTSKKKSADVAAIALGGRLRYKIPSVQRVYFAGSAYYAPSITSTLDADNLFEIGVRVGYELLPTANAYVGWRKVRVDYTKHIGSVNLDQGYFVGLDFTF
jgi:hypothetical protein